MGIEEKLLYHDLASMGSVIRTSIKIDVNKLATEIQPFQDSWKQYNLRKPQIRRYGLSLTSLDGNLTGIPDLDSIAEYNRQNNLRLNESHFNQATPALTAATSLQPAFEPFREQLGRCHLLRLDQGGFFPPHRDAHPVDDDSAITFRLFSTLHNVSENNFCFTLEDRKIQFTPGEVYFFDSRKAHSLFSFVDNATFLVMNLVLNLSSFRRMLELMRPK